MSEGINEAQEFLELLFGDYFQKYKGFIEILQNKQKPFYFDTIDGLLKKFDTFTGDVWFGVAPRDIERGLKTSITYITCIWADIDVGTEGHETPGIFNTKEDALNFINAIELKPSIIVDSGRGLHLYWLLKEPCSDLDIAEEILRGIILELQGDRGTWSRTKLLRLPGTLNCKVSGSPVECNVLAKTNLRYELKDFERYRVRGLKEFESKDVIFNKDAPLYTIDDLFTNKIAPEILSLIKDRDTKGKYLKTNGNIDRSERDQAVILELLNTGHKPEAIRGIFSNREYPVSDKYYSMGRRGDYYLALSIENAQRFLESGIKEGPGKKLIVPKEADSYLLTALLPELPIMIEQDGQQLLTFSYENKLTNTKVSGYTNKEMLKELNLTEADLKYREMTWEGFIGNYLMNTKARTGTDRIEGSVEEIVRFFNNKPRAEDYKRVEVNLKSLAVRQYIIKKDRQEVIFMVLHPFTFNEDTKTFTAGLSAMVPKVVGEITGRNTGPKYINKGPKEYNPKQTKYDYGVRNYFASIRHIIQDIPQIRGTTILEHTGYLADIKLKKKKYRNSEAQKIIDKFIKIGLQEYGFIVACHKQDLMLKDVRHKTYKIQIADKQRIIRKDDSFLTTLGNYILRQPGHNDLTISINRAQGLFNKYGVEAVKKVYFDNIKRVGFSLGDLERILARGVNGGKS